MRVILTIIRGAEEGRSITFAEPREFSIGRATDVDFSLQSETADLSRHHFAIDLSRGVPYLKDTRSQNGTFLNGKRVTEARSLSPEDTVRAGQTMFRVEIESLRDGDCEDSHEESSSIRTVATRHPTGRLGNPASSVQDLKVCLICEIELQTFNTPICSDVRLCVVCRQDMAEATQWHPDYIMAGEIARGAMGTVEKAIRKRDTMSVAIKTSNFLALPQGSELDLRLEREIKIQKRLVHRHIVTFFDAGVHESNKYIVMEYVRGKDASRLMIDERQISLARAHSLACGLLSGLDYAHQQGVLHRDIKPNNLLITKYDGQEILKLADFGLARETTEEEATRLTGKDRRAGHYPFVAPESLSNLSVRTEASDQYAAAACIYFLYTGLAPQRVCQTEPDLFNCILKEDAVPVKSRRADIPKSVAEVIHKALNRDPSRRFPNVQAMLHKLIKAT